MPTERTNGTEQRRNERINAKFLRVMLVDYCENNEGTKDNVY